MNANKVSPENSGNSACLRSVCAVIALAAAIIIEAKAVPPPNGVASVVVPANGFGIEGDLSTDFPIGVGDWITGATAPSGAVLSAAGLPVEPSLTMHFVDPFGTNTDLTLAGGLKWTDDPRTWSCTRGKTSAKTDIKNVMTHITEDANGHTWLIVGAGRLSTSGDKLTVEAGGDSLSYQWQHEGTNIAGATESSLILADVGAEDGGAYVVIVSNTAGNATSDPAILTITEPVVLPMIIRGPQSQNVELGTDVGMSVVATNGNLTYQWRYYGNDIAGATDSSLSLPSVQFSDAGLYDVVVANTSGSVISPTAILNVLPYLAGERDENLLTLTWPGPFILQEAPECTGPFEDIVSALSPYVVDVRLAPRKFFRLRAVDFDLEVTYLPGGEASLSVTGVPGLTFTIQASTDLVNWMNIYTNTAPATYVDVPPTQGMPRFYRAIPVLSMIPTSQGVSGKTAVKPQAPVASVLRFVPTSTR